MKAGRTLYGSTESGGATNGGGSNGDGAVFAFDPRNNKVIVLHVFTGGADGATPAAGLTPIKSKLYGVTFGGGATGNGTIFSLNPASGAESILYSFEGGDDGSGPEATLVNFRHVLYGETEFEGGASACSDGCGTLFSFRPQ